MLLSIITASYNSEKSIEKTFDSILNQTYKEIEFIVVDGKSKDKTVEIIKSWEPRFKKRNITFKWISEIDNGIYDAWNKGLAMVSGDWISFLGSDDYYENDALENYARFLKENPSREYVSSKVKIVNNPLINKIEHAWNWNVFKKQMIIGHVGSFHHKDYFAKYGIYNTSYKIAGDYELLLRAKNKLKAGFMDKYSVVMNGDGISLANVNDALYEAYRAKTETGGRNKLLANMDWFIIWIKIKLKGLFTSL